MAGLSNWTKEQEAAQLGAAVFERLVQLGATTEDAHRSAQQAVTGAFGGGSGVSASGATGSVDPAPGPKLPPPSQMMANLADMNQGSQPPPVPQASPSWWETSPGTWTSNPPPAPVTWQVITTSP